MRIEAPFGIYDITVKSNNTNAIIAPKGMDYNEISKDEPWDDFGKIKRTSIATNTAGVFKYRTIAYNNELALDIDNGNDKEITDIDIKPVKQVESTKRKLFILGDSTVKSYLHRDNPIFGYGNILTEMFNDDIEVYNYSQGGRSLKVMHQEGRFNDMMLNVSKGDYILLQSGHNDEARGEINGPEARFGKGNTPEGFLALLKLFGNTIKSLGANLILVTPMTRIDSAFYSDITIDDFDQYPVRFAGFENSPTKLEFPQIIRDYAQENDIPYIDINKFSKEYLAKLGGNGTKALFIGVEAGETPGLTNTGSSANGSPSMKCDGTHFREPLAREFAKYICETLRNTNHALSKYLKEDIIYPYIMKDCLTGSNAYYRAQIEKMVEKSILLPINEGEFSPKTNIACNEFIIGLNKIFGVELPLNDALNITRQEAAAYIIKAYTLQYGDKKLSYMMFDENTKDKNSGGFDFNISGIKAGYQPLTAFENIKDINEISSEYMDSVKKCLEMGLMRCDEDTHRGKVMNGEYFYPQKIITREKAAKLLYFLWVLTN